MGKGVLYLSVANAVFVLGSYVVQIGMGRYLGPADYGMFGVIIALMTIVNMLFSAGFPQSASKHISEDDTRIAGVVRVSNRITLAFCALVLVLYFGFAEVIANLFNDPGLTFYIRISALSIPAYAFSSIYGPGYLNGLRRFGRQSIALLGTSIVKVVAVFALVLIGFGLTGAIVGYLAAAAVGFLLAWRFLGPVGKTDADFNGKDLLEFGVPATAFAVAFFVLISVDLFAVKAIDGAGMEVGYYNASSTISRVPYFLLAGLATVLLPFISKSTSRGDHALTKRYIRQSIRYALMLLIPGTLLVSATSAGLLTLIYSSAYAAAADSLSVLIFGLALLSIFFVLSTIIMGGGKPGVAVWIAVPLIVIDILLNMALIPRYGLAGAAWSTTLAGSLGACASAVYVLRRFKALVSPMSFARIGLASIVVYVLALLVPVRPLWLPAFYMGLFVLYAGMLWLLRELNGEDVRSIRKVVPLLGVRNGSPGVADKGATLVEGDGWNR